MNATTNTDAAARICATCNGTGIGYAQFSFGCMETDCSDCDGSGEVNA